MAVAITLYTHTKRKNSTKQPSGAGQAHSCLLKEGTDVWNPTFILSTAPGQSINYCSAFGKWYYVDRMEYIPPHWHITCTLDPMATFKTQIGSASLYVTRAADTTNWDQRIVDTLPTQVDPVSKMTTFGNIFTHVNSGYYVVSLAGSMNASGCDHIVLTPLQYRSFLNEFLDSGLWDLPSVVDDSWKSQINPIDYIQDVRWYPFMPDIVSDTLHYIYVNGWETPARGYSMKEGYIYHKTASVVVQRHPDADTYGSFLNGPPYTRHTLVDPFFGTIPVDSSLFTTAYTLSYSIDVDPSCGFGHMRLTATDIDRDPMIITDMSGEFGVPVLFSQETHGGFQGVASNVGNAVSQLLSGNIAGAVGSFVGLTSSFGSTKLATTGSVGSRAMYQYAVALYSEYIPVKSIDYATMGHPICKTLTISSLSGFIQVAKGDVGVPGPSWAADQIKSYLEGGFYYE